MIKMDLIFIWQDYIFEQKAQDSTFKLHQIQPWIKKGGKKVKLQFNN